MRDILLLACLCYARAGCLCLYRRRDELGLARSDPQLVGLLYNFCFHKDNFVVLENNTKFELPATRHQLPATVQIAALIYRDSVKS